MKQDLWRVMQAARTARLRDALTGRKVPTPEAVTALARPACRAGQ